MSLTHATEIVWEKNDITFSAQQDVHVSTKYYFFYLQFNTSISHSNNEADKSHVYIIKQSTDK